MASTARTVLQTLLGWFGDFIEWVHGVMIGKESRRALIADLGGTPEQADRAGTVSFGPKHEVGYFAQAHDGLDPDQTVIGALRWHRAL